MPSAPLVTGTKLSTSSSLPMKNDVPAADIDALATMHEEVIIFTTAAALSAAAAAAADDASTAKTRSSSATNTYTCAELFRLSIILWLPRPQLHPHHHHHQQDVLSIWVSPSS